VHLQRHIADRWAQLGRMEHASVGSFARFSLELLALGAPPELLTEAAAAMADEVRHARSCFGLAEALGGAPVSPGALDLSGSLAHLDRSVDVHAIFTALLTEACVVETVAAAQAERALAAAVDPAVRAVLATIVADEARHAAYGWRCARWMLGAHPELRGLVRPLLARLAPADQALPPADPHAAILAHFGLLDRRAQAQAARDAHQKVIEPAAALLLREGPDFA
ncbi:MAG: ferritin-like domain-containing protein, partial [Deltaproteobacteria bacterium]|nr:ferritin-like domain-containing protein [Deltaproteobacteria bacterium]